MCVLTHIHMYIYVCVQVCIYVCVTILKCIWDVLTECGKKEKMFNFLNNNYNTFIAAAFKRQSFNTAVFPND